MGSGEEQPFLYEVEQHDQPGERHKKVTSKRQRLFHISLLCNVLLSVACVLLASSWLSSRSCIRLQSDDSAQSQLPETYSPANAIIEYEYRQVNHNDTRFRGKPGPEWEQHMHELMEGTLLRVSQEELDLHGSNSIPLTNGGYAAGLGVAHNLHCVKKIKKFLYREVYYADLDPAEFDYTRDHADHCLDWLRQAVMCNVDYTMYTVYWGERQQEIPTHELPGPQKCVNWDKLREWMLSRAANTDELVPP